MEDYEKDALATLQASINRIGELAPGLDEIVQLFNGRMSILPKHCRSALALMESLYAVLAELATVYFVPSHTVYVARDMIDGTAGLNELLNEFLPVCMGGGRLKKTISDKLNQFVEEMKIILQDCQTFTPTD